ncbi:MAG: formate--tetrahydrofolate ligase, partial [Candidatus Omnitrophota bacterium]
HGGCFANVAHGNNSIVATKLALRLADYVVTESGFGTDLGMEKFFDIICREADFKPDLVLLVVSVKALIAQGRENRKKTKEKSLKLLEAGFKNLDRHIDNVVKFGVPLVVAINRFPENHPDELKAIKLHCESRGIRAVVSEVVTKGGEGGRELAEAVLRTIQEKTSSFKPLYKLELPLKKKIEIVAHEIYGAKNVEYSQEADDVLEHLENLGFGSLPVNIAKTHFSLTDDPKIKGAPVGWSLKIREVRIMAGAGFVVPIAGRILLMPGLPEHPLAEKIDITSKGEIIGLS